MYRYKFLAKKLDDLSEEDLRNAECGYGEALVILSLRSMPYPEYLQKEHWAQVRAEKIEQKPLCECCRKRTAREIHHVSYENKGCELMEDLRSLCQQCHKEWHQHWSYKDPPGETFRVSLFDA